MIVAYPISLMSYLLMVFLILLALLDLAVITLIMWSLWIGGDIIGDLVTLEKILGI